MEGMENVVLVGVDGSPESGRAAEWAFAEAASLKWRIWFANIVPPAPVTDPRVELGYLRGAVREAELIFGSLMAEAESRGVPAQSRVIGGLPGTSWSGCQPGQDLEWSGGGTGPGSLPAWAVSPLLWPRTLPALPRSSLRPGVKACCPQTLQQFPNAADFPGKSSRRWRPVRRPYRCLPWPQGWHSATASRCAR